MSSGNGNKVGAGGSVRSGSHLYGIVQWKNECPGDILYITLPLRVS